LLIFISQNDILLFILEQSGEYKRKKKKKKQAIQLL